MKRNDFRVRSLALAGLALAPAIGLAADETASATLGGIALDTRTAAGEVRVVTSTDELLPAAGDPTYCGAESGEYTVTMARGSSVETLISSSKPAVAEFQLLAGATTFTYTDSECNTLVAVFTRATVPLGELGGVKLSGASAPKAGQPLVASVEGVEDPDALAYVWQRGKAAYGTGVFSYSTVLSTSSSYTPTAEDYDTMIRVVATDGVTAATNFVYFSRLPVVYLDGDIPTSKAQDYLEAKMRLQGGERFDSGLYEGDTEIKVRGNSTAGMPKKPYKLKLGSKANLLGLGGKTNKHWVLLANYLDQSLMRNTAAYRFSQNFGLVNMKTEWVDVIVNGTYQGNYQLCEHIRIADDRIKIFDWEDYGETVGKAALKDASAKAALAAIGVDDKGLFGENFSWLNTGVFSNDAGTADVSSVKGVMGNEIDGGFIFEFSHEYDELSKFTTKGGLRVMLNKPEFMYTNEEMMNFASNYIERCEAAWKSADGFNADGEHYSELVDVDSMVGFWLVNEIFGNNDASYKSRYACMDRGGKLTFGPVWDFDWGAGGITVGTGATGWKVSQYSAGAGFYKEWLDDPWFCKKAFDAYWAVHGELERLVADGGTLDGYRDYIAGSGAAESNRWYKTQQSSYGANVRGFEKDAAMFKTYMTERIAWLDRQFASVETLMASVKTSSSAAPYTRDAAKLGIGVAEGADAETVDGFVVRAYGGDLALSVKASGAASVKAFVDGVAVDGFEGASGTVTIPALAYSGGSALVSFVSYTSDGAVAARNYATIEKATHEWETDVPETGAATVYIEGVALDTRSTGEGNYRRLSAANLPLPFALSGDFSGAADAAYAVTLSNAEGESTWASGAGEAVKEWDYTCAGDNVFTLALADGTEYSATFGVSVTLASGGKSAEIGEDGLETATVRLSGAALDTRTAPGATRTLETADELLPFTMSGDFSQAGSDAAYHVALANDKGESIWAAGAGEAVKDWKPDVAGGNVFTLTDGDGKTLSAVFDVSLALASGGTAAEVGGAGTSVTVSLAGLGLDTRVAAGQVRAVASADEILPLAASGDLFATAAGSGAWRIDHTFGGTTESLATGSGTRTAEWKHFAAGRNILALSAGGASLTAVFDIDEALANYPPTETGELPGGDTPSAGAAVEVRLGEVALDTRYKAGAVRPALTKEDMACILPFALSGDFASAWEEGAEAPSYTVALSSDNGESTWASGAGEAVKEWTPDAAGTNEFTLVLADGSRLTARFEVSAAIASGGTAGEIEEDAKGVTVTVQRNAVPLDTRVAAGAVRTLATQEELDRLMALSYSGDAWKTGAGGAATVTASKDGGAEAVLVLGAAGEGTIPWLPAAAGTYAFVHTASDGSLETATFTIGEGLVYPGASALDPRGGVSWLYIAANPADASEWGYASAEEYAAWPEAVREAQTGEFTGVEVIDGVILLKFRVRFTEPASLKLVSPAQWAEATIASGKMQVLESDAPGGAETPVDLSFHSADALTVTLRVEATKEQAFYRLKLME